MREKIKFWRVTACFFALFLLLAAVIVPAAAEDTELQLYRRHPEENEPFRSVNMFPGDEVSKTYRLTVSYTGSITVHFRANVRPGYEKLAQVLKCRVTAAGEEVYDGLMAGMPSSLPRTIKDPEKELTYEITAYLDTSVGNEYMGQELVADFRWWVEKQDQSSLTPPKTGDDFPLVPLALGMGVSAAVILILVIRLKKKEGSDDGQ